MKKLISVLAAVSFAFIPFATVTAAVELPVSKKLVTTIPAPWGNTVPIQADFRAFACGDRVYLVWQSPVPNGRQGQMDSKLFAVKTDGAKISSSWLTMAEDSESSQVRFSGSCVGNRAVLVNHWEDPTHFTAGDMATSVDGSETYGPLWKPDGRTIYRWYRNDQYLWSDTNAVSTSTVRAPYALEIERTSAAIVGSVAVAKFGSVGSSVNYILDVNGRSHVLHAPWYKDLNQYAANSQFSDATYRELLTFRRLTNGWEVTAATSRGLILAPAYDRFDDSIDWLAGSAQLAVAKKQNETFWNCEAGKNRFTVKADGLYFAKGICYLGENGPVSVSADTRIHTAASADAPRVYIDGFDGTLGGNYFDRTGDTFAYAVRTGDGKVQVWTAAVK